jgi:predicted secreted protein
MLRTACITLISLTFLYPLPALSLQDQGLASIMDIIDRAVGELGNEQGGAPPGKQDEGKQNATSAASSTLVNLSRTLGKLSYSRLQCGEADVLAEFTLRVQKMPANVQDSMRDAFQEGFDAGKKDSPLLSEDECKRLTQSRNRSEKEQEANVKEEDKAAEQEEVVEAPKEIEDPRLKHLRIAELTGQLAWRRRFCGDDKVHSRDFNELIGKMPDEFQAEAKEAYWKGYQRGKLINKGFRKDNCS